MWTQWLAWATTNPDKRRALAQLEVAEDITHESHLAVDRSQRAMADVIVRARSHGSMATVPVSFVMALTGSIADLTMDESIRDPDTADACSAVAFDAVWRVLAG
jgi:hypothetical protein